MQSKGNMTISWQGGGMFSSRPWWSAWGGSRASRAPEGSYQVLFYLYLYTTLSIISIILSSALSLSFLQKHCPIYIYIYPSHAHKSHPALLNILSALQSFFISFIFSTRIPTQFSTCSSTRRCLAQPAMLLRTLSSAYRRHRKHKRQTDDEGK